MVLAKLYTDLVRAEAWAEGWEKGCAEGKTAGYAKGYTQGISEGREEMRALCRDWTARRKQAERAGRPFTEPEP